MLKTYVKNFYQLCFLLCLQSCATVTEGLLQDETTVVSDKIRFFVYPSGNFDAAEAGDAKLEEFFFDIIKHVGDKGPRGEVGIGIVFPYLTWTKGVGAGPYTISEKIKRFHRQFVRVASKMRIPILVQFNGGPWHTANSESAFLNYWKTVDGGKYLSRYKDGRVNESLHEVGVIDKESLDPYLNIGPYHAKHAKDSLFLTLSPYAFKYRQARLEALHRAVLFWKRLDSEYPGVITDFTTDSEVASFSHRFDQHGNEISIGYEEFVSKPFCQKFDIRDCNSFLKQDFTYKTEEQVNWFEFRSEMHGQYVADTVSIIRKTFPERPIWTHQIPVLDEEKRGRYRNRDFASPQTTAFVPDAFPGFTFYIYGKRDKKFKKLVKKVSLKAKEGPWGMLEFNPGKSWTGSREELKEYTFQVLNFAYEHGARVVAPLSWTNNELDTGIRKSGVDEGIKKFIREGSSLKHKR